MVVIVVMQCRMRLVTRLDVIISFYHRRNYLTAGQFTSNYIFK